jgi:hypothetical protein
MMYPTFRTLSCHTGKLRKQERELRLKNHILAKKYIVEKEKHQK